MKKLFKYERSHFFRDPNATLIVRREINQPKEPQHRHDFVELVIVVTGSALHRIEKLQYRLRPGDIFAINPRRSHGYEETENFHIANILIREDFFQKIHPSMAALPCYHTLFALEATSSRASGFESRTRLEGEDFQQAIQWTETLEREAVSTAIGGWALAEAALVLLIGLICRSSKGLAEAPETASTQIGRLLSWIESRVEQPIRMCDMARIAGMSERTLLRRFQEATGRSPLEHVIETRLRRARALLENSAMNLSHDEIAWRCGFENGNYLARRFKKWTGVSPREWRQSRAI